MIANPVVERPADRSKVALVVQKFSFASRTVM
jgi:hypothetical protein